MEMPTAIDMSSVVGLVAVGALTANILMGLLMSSGYNPHRQWPRRRVKIFTFHNWTGYTSLALVVLHPSLMLVSTKYRFRVVDIFWPLSSPQQPGINTIGAIALYLVAFVVLTSYFRRVFGFRRWKQLHYTAYAAACVFFIHGILSDPLLENRPVDWIDAEKVYVEGCALIVAIATGWRIHVWRKRGRVVSTTV